MKTTRHTPLATLLLFSAFSLQPLALRAQGTLTPPGPPAPTMKTLDQIEARTPISSAPFTITQPGSYYLTTNLIVNFGNAINITTNGVTLDLNGFGIISTESPASTGIAIGLSSGLRNIVIANGYIQGGVTNNGSGIYSGNGFGYGIACFSSPPVNARVSGLSVSGCLLDGIYLNTGDSTVVESCTVRTVGGRGIVASTIKSSTAMACGSDAIAGDEVSDSRGQCIGVGDGLYAHYTAQNCYGYTGGNGDGLAVGNTAQNCYGYSGGNGNGLTADSTAQNCYGQSSGTGDGLYAVTALNCMGENSGSGDGLLAVAAQNCWGYNSSSGSGLEADATAIGCYGQSNSGTGLNAGDIAIGCEGFSSSGTGLAASIANSCAGNTGDGSIANKYNMP